MPLPRAISWLFLSLALPLTALAAERAVPVGVTVVRDSQVREVVRLTGTATAARAANLSPQTSGLVTVLTVDAGSRVSAGDTLLELDAELADWQAQSARAAVRAAKVALDDARRRLEEAEALAPQQSIAETAIRDLAAEVAQDEAALQQAEAEAGLREAMLERHRVRAPFDGVVAAKLTEVGEWVGPGDAVLELVATADLRLDFEVAEQYVHRILPGAPVSYTTGLARDEARSGTVATAVPVSDPVARTFLLRVDPAQEGAYLRPGISVRGEVLLDAGRTAPVVPRDAIIRYPDGRVIVWVVSAGADGDQVNEQRVTTGLNFDGLVEIREGLAAGARVVTHGNESLRAGQRVTVRAAGND